MPKNLPDHYLFLLISALKTKACVMALLVPAKLKFNLSLLKILVPYRLLTGP